jgi:hypothetical protein
MTIDADRKPSGASRQPGLRAAESHYASNSDMVSRQQCLRRPAYGPTLPPGWTLFARSVAISG